MATSKRRAQRRREERTATVTLPVDLLERAKIAAIKRNVSFKALIAEGLRLVLARHKGET